MAHCRYCSVSLKVSPFRKNDAIQPRKYTWTTAKPHHTLDGRANQATTFAGSSLVRTVTRRSKNLVEISGLLERGGGCGGLLAQRVEPPDAPQEQDHQQDVADGQHQGHPGVVVAQGVVEERVDEVGCHGDGDQHCCRHAPFTPAVSQVDPNGGSEP